MQIVIMILGLLQMAVSVAVIDSAAGAIHETTAAVLFGFGSTCLALALILGKISPR